MDQPFEVKINTIFGEHIDTIEARTHMGNYDSNGKPKNLGKVSVKSLARSNWPVGLYKQTITFTEYATHRTRIYRFLFFDTKTFRKTNKTSL